MKKVGTAAALRTAPWIVFCAALAAAPVSVAVSCATAPRGSSLDLGPDDFWRVSTPEAEGIDPAAVRRHLDLAMRTGADATLVARDGAIVSEWYSSRYPSQGAHYAMSSTKSVASLVAGIMRDDGLLDLDAPISTYVPGWGEGLRAEVTARMLLAQTSGLPRAASDEESVGFAADKNAFVLRLEPRAAPGTVWSYSNEGYQLLSPVLEGLSEGGLQAYARDRLFLPVGMRSTRFHEYSGSVWTYADMETSLRDFARLGVLMLNGGTWGGKRIVSEEYIAEATSPQPLNRRYGLGWWIHSKARDGFDGYSMQGYLDTSLFVIPSARLVIARIQAPRNGYSGEGESGNYLAEAEKLFARLAGR